MKISSEFLNYHDQELNPEHLVEIRKYSAHEEAEEPKPEPLTKPRNLSLRP
jgi:hypothetical protein